MTKNQEPSICPRCGKQFSCSKSGKCWCYEVILSLDVLEAIEEQFDSCLCPKCLGELSRSKYNPDGKISFKNLIKLPYKGNKA